MTRTYTVRLTELEVRAVKSAFFHFGVLSDNIKIVGLVFTVPNDLKHATLRTLHMFQNSDYDDRHQRAAAKRVHSKLFNTIKEAGGFTTQI